MLFITLLCTEIHDLLLPHIVVIPLLFYLCHAAFDKETESCTDFLTWRESKLLIISSIGPMHFSTFSRPRFATHDLTILLRCLHTQITWNIASYTAWSIDESSILELHGLPLQ